MKAAVLVQLNQPLEIAELTLRSKLDFGQVLVAVRYSGICGAQLNEIEGAKGPDKFLPHLLGHEGGGVVLECGPGVKRVAAGDHVVMHWRKAEGIHSATPSYDWNGRRVNAGWVTTFNDTAVVSENRLTPIPKSIPLDIAALYGCALTTGFGVINHDARLTIGESVVVFGVGGVGITTILGASLAGGYPIVAVDPVPEKLELARKFGATHTLAVAADESTHDSLVELNGGRLFDVAVENTGRSSVIQAAYKVSGPGGRVILVGVPRHDDPITIDSLPLHFDKILTGSEGGGTIPSRDIPRYLRLQEAGRYELSELISHRFRLEEVNLALDTFRAGKAYRCMLEMG